MSESSVKTDVATSNQSVDTKQSDKEINFSRLREERDQARRREETALKAVSEMEERIKKLEASKSQTQEEEDSDDIYAEVKRLKREIKEVKKSSIEETQKAIEMERKALARYKLKTDYPDFDKVVTPEIADKLVQQNPRLAEMLARVPEEDRLPLIYETIQMTGLHKPPEPPKPFAQDKINKNLSNTFYTPATAGHGAPQMGDFSEAGRKAAYAQMRELLKRPISAS